VRRCKLLSHHLLGRQVTFVFVLEQQLGKFHLTTSPPSQVLNKIDLPGADVDRVKREIEEVIGLDCSDALACSAKMVRLCA